METPATSLHKMFRDPRWMVLAGVLGLLALLIYLVDEALLPILMAFILAYFLDGGVKQLMRFNLRRTPSVVIIYSLFILVCIIGLMGPLQAAAQQSIRLAEAFPHIVSKTTTVLSSLPLPAFMEQIVPGGKQGLVDLIVENIRIHGETLLTHTFSGITGATSLIMYLFVTLLLVFFFLKDKVALQKGLIRVLPKEREFLEKVWYEMELRMANYIRGKIWEILIVGVVTWVVFRVLGFQYSAIMALISGISVVIPYVGAVVVAIPVFLLGLVQWGFGWEVSWLLGTYAAIQFLDGNVLVPLVFSEAVQLNPTVILLAFLIFGALWGFWGVFFAIPLASLTKALVTTWIEYREASQ